MTTQFSDSARQAEAILREWLDGDRIRFQREVDAVAELVTSSSNTSEMERIEVLKGIATALRDEKHHLQDSNTRVYRDLLRHLASGQARITGAEECGN